jgi:DNA polymerase III subunit alpha
MAGFAHLHVHNQYSILAGASSIQILFYRTKSLGMEAIAITDHGNMFGVKEFQNTAVKKGIKPIIGCEIYVDKKPISEGNVKEDRSGLEFPLLSELLHNL